MFCNCNKGKNFFFKYGWDHVWCDTADRLAVKEVIKGPFKKPKILCSVPYVTRCQQEGTSVKFCQGIPDCWEEYLLLSFLENYCQNHELMHTRTSDVVPFLRKYRLYLGQGIPDPWALYPYIDNSEIFSNPKTTEKHSPQYTRSGSIKGRCFCCQKKYLFGCPDKYSDAHYCSCKDCHKKNTALADSNEKCRCNEIFQHWLSDHTNLIKRNLKENCSLSSPNHSESETEEETDKKRKKKNKYVVICHCLQDPKAQELWFESGDCNTNEKSFKLNSKNCKDSSKIYFCPYIKNFYIKKKSLLNESDKECCLEPKISVSKEIQTEIYLKKSSKTVQTEKSEKTTQLKCTCQNKCFPCSYKCSVPCMKGGCMAMHSVPSFCCPNCIQTPTYVCPFSFGSHCTIQKYNKYNKKHKKKNYHKDSESEGESNTENKDNLQVSKSGNSSLLKSTTKWNYPEHEPTKTSNENLGYNKSAYYYQAPKTFNHLKYLTDYKLKNYLQQKEIFPETTDTKNMKKFHVSI